MRNWRVLTAIAAVVLAALAGVLVWKYVSDADSRARHKVEGVLVVVARERIPRGTSGATALRDDLFATAKIPRASVPPGTVLAGRAADLTNQVAATDIPAGLPIVASLFTAPGAGTGAVSGIISDPTKQAIAISVDDQHGVAGFVSPGDRVNVLLTVDAKDISQKSGEALKTTAFLIPGVKVLAVGRTTLVPPPPAPATGGRRGASTTTTTAPTPQARGLLTLEVTPRQAEQLAHAEASGTLYLTLDAPGFDPGRFQNPDEIVELLNEFDQELRVLDQGFALQRQAK